MSTLPIPTDPTLSPPKLKIGLVSIVLCATVSSAMTVAAGGGLTVYLLRSGKLAPGKTAAAPVVPAAPPPSHVIAFDPIVVNLSDGGGHSYLRVALSLRVADLPKEKGAKAEAEGAKVPAGAPAELRDTALMVLSGQSSDRLLATNGREELKEALKNSFAKRNADAHVIEVYLTELLVQHG